MLGGLPGDPGGPPPSYRILDEAALPSCTRIRLEYTVDDGPPVPAFLLRPLDGRGAGSGALALHATDLSNGSASVVGIRGAPRRDYALRMVEAGLVVLAPSYPTMGGYDPPWSRLGYGSGSMKAVWDNIRAIDLLTSLPGVAPDGVGIVGHSLGGHGAIFTAVYDPRVRSLVSSCGFDLFADYQGGDLSNWRQDCYLPNLTPPVPFDFDDLVGELADRSIFVSAPLHDTNFSHASVRTIAARVTPRFSARGGTLHLVHPDAGHDFPLSIQRAAVTFLCEHLARSGG